MNMIHEINSDEVTAGDLALAIYPLEIPLLRSKNTIISYGRIPGPYAAIVVERGEKRCTLNFHYDKKRQEILYFRYLEHSGCEEYWDKRATGVEISFRRWDGGGEPFQRESIHKTQGGLIWYRRMTSARKKLLRSRSMIR